MRTLLLLLIAPILTAVSTLPATGSDLQPLLKTLRSVGPKGAGNREAAAAWEELARADAAQLPIVLAGLDDAGPLAANWLRTAADAIVQQQLRRGGKLPTGELERFVLDARHVPRARRLAYEWLRRVDRSAPQRLVPRMLDDPSLEMRRDAVARLIEQGGALAEADRRKEAVAVYRKAFAAARGLDQVKLLASRLGKLQQTVDLPRHFGYLLRWKVIGPLDNTDQEGFDRVYPPEQQIDLQASFDGKHGQIRWIDHVTTDDYGKVDFNQVLAKEKAVVAYAMCEFISAGQQEVDLRAKSDAAIKIWLNGRPIARHHVYHTGSQMDQYTSRVAIRPGRNVILVKVGQNAITPDWADPWSFSLRVCDRTGAAVLSTDRDR